MKKYLLFRIQCLVPVFLLVLYISSFGQSPVETNQKTPYYIDIISAEKSVVYEILDGQLSLQYHDGIGYSKEIDLNIYNWNLELVGSFILDKTYGLNLYTIDLKNLIGDLETGMNYFCNLADEANTEYELTFKQVNPLKTDLQVDIIVNPLNVSCEKTGFNLVEFSGNIVKGKAPYSVRWYVLNSAQTDFLYQPKEEKNVKTGATPVVQVDKSPAYYVMFDVTDACGTNSQKMVFVDCGKKEKQVNTVFVEPLKDNSLPKFNR